MRPCHGLLFAILLTPACTPAPPASVPAKPAEAPTPTEVAPEPEPMPTTLSTCSGVPSPALAQKRRPKASCCHVSSSRWRELFRPLRERFARCPHGTGRVTVRVTVEEDGSIVDACVEHPSSWTDESRACLLAATLDLKLPAEDYDFCPVRKVVYPFQFK